MTTINEPMVIEVKLSSGHADFNTAHGWVNNIHIKLLPADEINTQALLAEYVNCYLGDISAVPLNNNAGFKEAAEEVNKELLAFQEIITGTAMDGDKLEVISGGKLLSAKVNIYPRPNPEPPVMYAQSKLVFTPVYTGNM